MARRAYKRVVTSRPYQTVVPRGTRDGVQRTWIRGELQRGRRHNARFALKHPVTTDARGIRARGNICASERSESINKRLTICT